jgi:hypothetical protein
MKTNGAEGEAKHNLNANSPGSFSGKSTIRTVRSFETPSVSSSESPPGRNSRFSTSVNSNASATTYSSQQQQQSQDETTVRLKEPSPEVETPVAKPPSMGMSHGPVTPSKMGESASDPSSTLQVPGADRSREPSPTRGAEGSPGWDGTVGKAALGKTGRVINKLVSDNEALKRDIKLERMKAEESKQAAKLMEDKMERMVSEYESRLLEANVTKTLLSRKERQVESLQSDVELQRQRAADAQEREHKWKDEMDKTRQTTNAQVEEAKARAALMEGRYNAIASHWKDQGDQVNRTATNLQKKISTLILERKSDDDKINALRDLCDEQDSNIRDLKRQKDQIGSQFKNYKEEQERLLHDIKTGAREREVEQEQTIAETKKVLGELRWALNLKKNVPGYE